MSSTVPPLAWMLWYFCPRCQPRVFAADMACHYGGFETRCAWHAGVTHLVLLQGVVPGINERRVVPYLFVGGCPRVHFLVVCGVVLQG